MYSVTIKPKVDKMFSELWTKVDRIISETDFTNNVISKIALIVSSETASRSKTILSDMLFDLSDALLKTPFFTDTSRQNKFMELNLRQEIFSKYQFSTSGTIDYKEATRIVQSLKLGGTTFAISGIGAISVVLIKGLPLSSLVPIPICVLVVVALGVVLVDYYALEPNRSEKKLKEAVKTHLDEVQQQFLNWFNEVERYFNKRVDEIKLTM